MRLTVAAVGRLKSGPERELADRYRERAIQVGRGLGFRALDVVEVEESRSRDPERRMLEESIAIANLTAEGSTTVVLDPRGESLPSDVFAATLREWRDAGRADALFVLGGPDGIAGSLRDGAALRMSFGSQTWPHQLARVMLLEQIYRAMTILAGHPYHRA